MPVLVIGTFNDDESVNAMTAAWGGISDDNEIAICLSKEHKTTKNIINRQAFTISIATKELMKEADYFGIKSGNDIKDKFLKSKLTFIKSSFVDAPIILEFPMTLECKLKKQVGECLYIANILNINVDDSVLNNGTIDYKKLNPITYDPVKANYIELGEIVGKAYTHGDEF